MEVESPLTPEQELEKARIIALLDKEIAEVRANGGKRKSGRKPKAKRIPRGEIVRKQRLRRAIEVLFERAFAGERWAHEHIANRMGGTQDRVERIAMMQVNTVNNNTGVVPLDKRYATYDEYRDAMLQQGVDIERIPKLADFSEAPPPDIEAERQQEQGDS